MKFNLHLRFLPALAAVAACMALPFPASAAEAGKIKTGLYAGMEMGQFVKYHYWENDLKYSWRDRTILEYTSDYAYSENLSIDLGLGAYMWYYSFPSEFNINERDHNDKFVSLYIPVAKGNYRFGNPEKPALTAEFGMFPFKYDEDARNLGEYLFRTGAYPNYILTDFDFAFARLTGFHFSRTDFGNWKNDILLTMETDLQPRFDWTFTYLTEYKLGSALTLGAGVAFTNFLSANADYTTPKSVQGDAYVTNLHTDSLDIGGTKVPITSGDTGYYTFQSTKLMARASFNPLSFLRSSLPRLDELKIYGEVALLGVKNYPRPTPDDTSMVYGFFTDRMQRLPCMFGINLPTFGLLDLFSMEAEWYGLRAPNSTDNLNQHVAVPLPQQVNANTRPEFPGKYVNSDYVKDNWKWSIYAKREIVPGLDLVAQAARDHVHHSIGYALQKDFEEVLTRPSQWWWEAKVAFHY